MTLIKKLQAIEDWNGLQSDYGGGDYNVTVWANPGFNDIDEAYELIFCRSDSFIAHSREYVSADKLESAMREYQPDLRRWRKVVYEV